MATMRPVSAVAIVWVPDIRFTSCDLRVLMDQPTEAISSYDASSRPDDRWFGRPERGCLPQGAVRAVAVVVMRVIVSRGCLVESL